MQKVLGPEFFDRPTLTVAKELLGKFLVRRVGGKTIALMITETEAYDGFKDLASHAHRGKTPRNTPMFAGPGTIYVYFTYGMHWMLNLVCGEEEYPAAVLIRGVKAVPRKSSHSGVLDFLARKSLSPRADALRSPLHSSFALNGPAKLTKYLAIDKTLTGKMLGKKSGLWIEDRGVTIKPRQVERTPRIGIAYAGEYVQKPWRFLLVKK